MLPHQYGFADDDRVFGHYVYARFIQNTDNSARGAGNDGRLAVQKLAALQKCRPSISFSGSMASRTVFVSMLSGRGI